MRTGWCVQVLWVAAALWAVPVGASDRPDLKGTVKGSDGAAVSGASVFIYTAGPKEGPGILCPSCYADCAKRTKTDSSGGFTIEDLDPTLLFKVLVVANGHQPEFVSKVDPASGAIEATLKPAAKDVPPDRKMRGRILGADGQPIEGAAVGIRGVTRGRGTRFGGNNDVDPLAVSDERGEFAITSTNAFEAVGVEVEARAHAKGVFPNLATGETVHELRLHEGVSIKGRIVKDGAPLAGIEVGISGAQRESSVYVGNWSVATDEEGQFHFANIPGEEAYQLYAKMQSLGQHGAVPARVVKSGANGSILDVGELKVEPAFALAGRVVLASGEALPEKTRVLVGRENAWDSAQVEVDSEGRFTVTGVPRETITVSARVKDHRLTTRNASLDPFNPFHLTGTMIGDKTNLVLEFEPGPSHQRLDGDQQAIEEEPLRGAEPVERIADGIQLAGMVVDDATGDPVPRFTVTEGRKGQYQEGITWFETRKHEFTDGKFNLSFYKTARPPGVAVEAKGYTPSQAGPFESTETNIVVRLKKGAELAAVLLRPDGSPASNATVYLADSQRNGVYLGEDMKVRDEIYQGTKKAETDANGRFAFAPQIDAHSIIVVEEAGYLNLPVAEIKDEVRLQPWAKVKGRLMIGARPGANESVRLWPAHVPYADHPRQFPALQIYLQTKTDADGNFEFGRVPPIALEVYHEPKVREGRMGTIAMAQTTKFIAAPGETKELVLGGKGRPVTGKLVLDHYEGKVDWKADLQTLELVVDEPQELSMKAFHEEWREKFQAAETDEAKAALQSEMGQAHSKQVERMRDFYRTEAGLAHHFAKKRYALKFADDGSFRVEDVPGGKYTLQIELREPGEGMNRFMAPRIAGLRKEIEVPESPGGRSDEPFELGEIPLQAKGTLKVGKAAPPFEVKTLEGKVAKLEDYKGKFLLLDFWAVWCGPCVAETPHLKETYEQFKNDDRFAMLALSLDPKEDAPRKYAAKNRIEWTQGFLGEWSKTELPNRYGVEGIPAIFLIGPDGKVVASGLRGEGIRAAVAAALQRF